MNGRKGLSQLWRERGITAKFGVALGGLLVLIGLIAIASIVALTVVRRQTETAIITSTEIQRLVFEMNGDLEKARRLEKDFFLRYPTVGYSVAYQKYAQPADEQVMQVRALSAELQQLISESDVSAAWQESDVNMNLYLSAAGRHAATVGEAAQLVAKLAADDVASGSEVGLQARLAQNSSLLQDALQLANDPGLMVLYYRVQSFEKDYLIARQRPLMQSAFNAAVPLREAIELVPTLEADQKAQALAHLDNYLTTAEEVLELDVAIRGKFNEFDLQAEAVDPITEELITLGNQEVERARAQIGRVNQLVTGILIATALVGLALGSMIARGLNNSITHNVVELTKTAGELRAGNLEARARIDSADEIGQLADSFNTMAARLSSLVGGLEQQVAERTAELVTANEQLGQEIVEHEQAEEALRRERDFAESLIETAQVIVLMLDTEGRIVRFNPYMAEISGYSLQEVEDRDWVATFLPERDQIRVREVFQEAVADVQTKGEVNAIVTKDGRERKIEWYDKTLKDADGNVVGLLAIGQDITERVQVESQRDASLEALRVSEERFDLAVQGSEAGLWDWDIPDNSLYWSPRFKELLGYADDELEVDFHTFESHLHPDDKEHTEAAIEDHLKDRGRYDVEQRLRTKSGEYRWFQSRGQVLWDEAGNPLRMVGSTTDITQRKRAESQRDAALEALKEHSERLEEMVDERTQELRDAQEQLIRQEKLAFLGQLAGSVAHEMRNPLGVISNAVFYLKMILPDADETTSEYLDLISSEVRNSDGIVADLLDFGRTRMADREKTAVSVLVAGVLEKRPPPQDVEVTTQLPPDLPPVFTDPRQMGQVLGNLVTNAYQAMPEGGSLTISAAGRGDPRGRPQVSISIADTGCGISQENLKKLFEPLFTTKMRGIGLGLAVSRSLAESNGGSIEVESQEGKGSTFTVILPTKEALTS